MEVYDALARARARGERVVLVTLVESAEDAPGRPGAKLVADGERAVSGTLGCSELDAAALDVAAEALTSSEGTVQRRVPPEGGQEPWLLFAEVHEPEPSLIVLGATPVARAVAAVARVAERRVTLVAVGGETDVPSGVEVKADDPGRYLLAAPPGPRDAVLVSDHDAPWVDEALRVSLASEAAFVGMLGSRRHAPTAVRRLRDAGVPEAHLGRLRAPVGLDIGSRGPGEIAVSIVAELLAVERGASARPLGVDWSQV